MDDKSFHNLVAWQQAHKFVLLVYKETENYPKQEMFGLTSQYRRAAVSIAANIAEGYAKRSKQDKNRFFNIAQGSINECDYYLLLSKDLNYISFEKYLQMSELISQVSKLLQKYIEKISKDIEQLKKSIQLPTSNFQLPNDE